MASRLGQGSDREDRRCEDGERQDGQRSATALAVLLLVSLLSALGAVLPALLPDFQPLADIAELPAMERQALPFTLVAIVATVVLLVRRARMLPPARFGRWIGQSMLAGIGLFLMPALLAHLAASSISDFTRAGLMMLTPIFTVVLEPYLGDGQAHQGRGALLAAIAGAVGAFCIFPVFIPFTVSASAAFFAIILAAACAAASTCYAVRLVAVLPSKSIAPFAAVATATAAVGYAAVGLAVEPFVWHGLPAALLLSALVEAPARYLLFWLMRRLSASRITTRYLLAPAIAILTGAVMLRSPLVLRNWLGLGLIVPGAAYLLLSGEERSEETGLSLK